MTILRSLKNLNYIIFGNRGEAVKLAHLIESASLKRKYMTKNYEKIFI